MVGYINKLDSFATFEGKGIRFCVFMQGCSLSCQYCHNADTKCFYNSLPSERKDKIICLESQELADKIIKNKGYYKKGGVTFSGGEPLLQADFILETTRLLKAEGIHVAIDTSGAMNDAVKELVDVADMFIIDLKFACGEDYEKYCGADVFDQTQELIKLCKAKNKEIMLRTVVIPTINDSVEKLLVYKKVVDGYGLFDKWELLPFHTLGYNKYQEIGETNKLEHLSALTVERLDELRAMLAKSI